MEESETLIPPEQSIRKIIRQYFYSPQNQIVKKKIVFLLLFLKHGQAKSI